MCSWFCEIEKEDRHVCFVWCAREIGVFIERECVLSDDCGLRIAFLQISSLICFNRVGRVLLEIVLVGNMTKVCVVKKYAQHLPYVVFVHVESNERNNTL